MKATIPADSIAYTEYTYPYVIETPTQLDTLLGNTPPDRKTKFYAMLPIETVVADIDIISTDTEENDVEFSRTIHITLLCSQKTPADIDKDVGEVRVVFAATTPPDEVIQRLQDGAVDLLQSRKEQ